MNNYLKLTLPLLFLLIVVNTAGVNAEPKILNPQFKIDKLLSSKFSSSTMAFLGKDDVIVLDRDEGKVYRFTGGIQSGPLLDVNVATNGYRGLLGIAVSINKNTTDVFLYFTESASLDSTDKNQPPVNPLGNRVYRYELVENKLVYPRLLLNLPVLPGPKDNGGVVEIGPDNNVYLVIGDLLGSFRNKQYETMTQNYQNSTTVDGRAGILLISQNGQPVGKGILGSTFPLNLYYAYGIRNSFGMDWDPETGLLWDSENGPDFGDELNLVEPGFNSGWVTVQGIWKPNLEKIGPLSITPQELVDFNGKGKYRAPEFNWLVPVGPSAIRFFKSDKFGPEYKNDLFVGDSNDGNIYHFELNASRNGLQLPVPLQDKVANNNQELESVIFASGFGQVTDIKVGPDGYLYVLATAKKMTSLYRISPQ